MIDRIPGLHPEIAPGILAVYNRLERLYPGVPHSIRLVHLSEGTHAMTNNHGDILLNTLYFGLVPKLLDLDLAKHESTALVPSDILVHEWGHVLTFAKGIDNLKGEFYALASTMLNAIIKDPKTLPISEYAIVAGSLEALAEAFVLFDRNETNVYANIANLAFQDLRKG